MSQRDFSLTREDYSLALLAKDTHNVGALVHQLSWVLDKIWAMAKRDGEGTTWVNQHPIVRLYAQRISELCGPRGYEAARLLCAEMANKTV